MRLSLSLSPTLSYRQEQRLEQRLTLEQRQRIEQRMVQKHLLLIKKVHDIKYRPQCKCGGCGKMIKPVDILRGFSDDLTDTRTTCPRCGHKTQPILVGRPQESRRIEVAFYCPDQTLDHLRTIGSIPFYELERDYPVILHSATAHFGNIASAYKRIGIDYEVPAILNWQRRVKTVLGLLPDKHIADVVGTTVYQIRKLRKRFKVPGFKKRILL